mmetsp:Transcript_20174/g.44903  ORF Transcript_20174/g.44903 Transcript_20174/m.44903 type:complete len:357 (-) Transcript_20174:135-1205(-)
MMNTKQQQQQPSFSSDGFDLDAAASTGADASSGADVVYELGGGATEVPAPAPAPAAAVTTNDAEAAAVGTTDPDAPPDPLAKSKAAKAEGNASFKAGDYLDAYDSYTDAIEGCPGEPTGSQLLKMREEFEEAEREKAAQRHQEEMDRRRKKDMKEADKKHRAARTKFRDEDDAAAGEASADGSKSGDEESDSDDGDDDDEGEKEPPARFDPPKHPHASDLAVYHANRAACSLHLNRPSECVEDCTVAVMLNPTYVKAYMRRSAAHEALEQTEDALKDAKVALEIDPRNAAARTNVARLQKIEDERLEKLKVETLGKLKDLGNSILGNFGLSLDNFNAVKDENTGSYSISFNQGGGT